MYGQNLEFSGEIAFRVFALDGSLVQHRVLGVEEAFRWNTNHAFDLSRECGLLGLDPSLNYGAFVGFGGAKVGFPNRFKLGLNIRKLSSEIGTNICFAPLVQAAHSMDKPFTRRWFPLGGAANFIGTVHLTDFEKNPEKKSFKFRLSL
jgi:hypothetical protein